MGKGSGKAAGNMKMTYFVEGIQGSGKSTLVKLLSEKCPDHKVLEEGDYSPVELAWCAYMGMEDYRAALEKHNSLRPEIEAKTHFEDDHAVVCYTKIRTDDRNFYQAMEKYEIYNNRVSFERFKDIVLKRYGRWDGAPLITECALFQNIVEDMILFRDMPDEDIIDFYRDIKKAIGDKQIQIAYLILRQKRMISEGILRQHGRPESMIKAMRSGFRCSVNILTTVLMQSEPALKAKTA